MAITQEAMAWAVNLYEKGYTLREAADATGMSTNTLLKYIHKHGIKSYRDKLPPPPRFDGPVHIGSNTNRTPATPRLLDPEIIARRNEIVELRLQGKTLSEIGAIYNITRERVRQILMASGDPRVKSYRRPPIVRTCMGCGKEFRPKNRHVKYCSLPCFYNNRPKHLTNRQREILSHVMKRRPEGATWQQIASELYKNSRSKGENQTGSVIYRFKLAAEKSGIDPTPYMGRFDHKTKKLNKLKEREKKTHQPVVLDRGQQTLTL